VKKTLPAAILGTMLLFVSSRMASDTVAAEIGLGPWVSQGVRAQRKPTVQSRSHEAPPPTTIPLGESAAKSAA
jgi:hypothetical protein